jgi:hypothetical protein
VVPPVGLVAEATTAAEEAAASFFT